MTRFEPQISGAGGDRSTTESQTLPADSNLQPFGSPNVLNVTISVTRILIKFANSIKITKVGQKI